MTNNNDTVTAARNKTRVLVHAIMDKGFYVRDNSGLDAYGYEFAACDETGAVHMADTINQLHGIVIKNAQSPYPTAYADMPITALFTGQYMPLRA